VSTDGATSDLLDLIDRLAVLLHRSDLTEIAVESGGTGLVLRKAVASAAPAGQAGSTSGADAAHGSGAANPVSGSLGEPSAAGREPAPPSVPSIKAPLTGLFYASPAPGTAPYVQAGGEVAVGQVIGLIEAMKLFNEIKSDLAGRVIRVVAESGALVKAKQPLIEVEPL
jgi:acetyl-CoA carboxylase biotin carboxyl carrier protein